MTQRAGVAGLIGGVLVSAVVMAEPGQGIHTGPWTLSPYARLTGTYDSNVGKEPSNAKDDYFLDSETGFKAGYSAYEIDFSGLGFLGYRNYSDLTEQNFSSGGEILKFKEGTHDTVAIEADQTFRRVEDIDQHGSEAAVAGVSPDSVLDASARSRRDINSAGLSMGHNLTDKMQLDVGYRYDEVSYSDPGLLELQNHMGQAETAYRMTDKTDALLTLKAGMQDNGEIRDPAGYYAGRAGMKTRGTDKLTFKGGVGAQQFDRSSADDVTAFNYDVSATLAVSDKIALQAGGRNGILLSSLYADNGSRYDSVWGGISYACSSAIVMSGNIAYRRDDYLDPVSTVDGMKSRVDDGTAVRMRVDYQTPAKFMSLYSQMSYEMVSSQAVPDYDETRVDVGVNFQY